MNYSQFAKDLIYNFGGQDNMKEAYYCKTRLRINVAEKTQVSTDKNKAADIVKQDQYKGKELQIDIGTEVNQVYDEFIKHVDPSKLGQSEPSSDEKRNVFSKVVDFLGGIFVPIIPALVAGGMLKSITTLLTTFGWLDGASDLAVLLNIAADSVFYFLPFFIAVTSARVIKTNEFLALMVAGSIMYPTLINGLESGAAALSVFGVSIPVIAYNGSVFPVILGVVLLKYVYGFLDKYIHKNIRMIFAPLFAILITVPISLALLAPIGHYLGIYLAQGLAWIFNTNGFIAATLMGFFLPLIVMAGMHQALFPLMLTNLAEVGIDKMLPLFYLQTFAIAGATYAVFFASKKADKKAVALSTAITATFGITEPALYGLAIPLKKPLIAGLIASGVAGGLSNLLGVSAFAFGLPSFLSIPTYVDAAQGSSLVDVLISSVVALGLGFIISYILMKREKEDEVPSESVVQTESQTKSEPQLNITANEMIYAPVNDGQILALSDVKDNVFAQEIMGPTVAIKPHNNDVYAPVSGEIIMFSDTKHALGIRTKSGLEVLIHIGIDTVKLNGEPFSSTLEVGDTVNHGDLITTVDLDYLKERNVDNTIIIAITNYNQLNKLIDANTKVTNQSAILQTSI